jgi:hypothetical protein
MIALTYAVLIRSRTFQRVGGSLIPAARKDWSDGITGIVGDFLAIHGKGTAGL